MGDQKFSDANPYTNCSAGIDHGAMTEKINKLCDGKISCTVELNDQTTYTKEF